MNDNKCTYTGSLSEKHGYSSPCLLIKQKDGNGGCEPCRRKRMNDIIECQKYYGAEEVPSQIPKNETSSSVPKEDISSEKNETSSSIP